MMEIDTETTHQFLNNSNGRITMQLDSKVEKPAPPNSDSAFGSDEIENDLDDSFEYATSQKSSDSRANRSNLQEIHGTTHFLTLPRMNKNMVHPYSVSTISGPLNCLMPILLGHDMKTGTIGRPTKGLTFKPFNRKEKLSWLEVSPDRGFIRLFDPLAQLKRSVVVPCSLKTSAAEIASKLSLTSDDLHVQLSGDVLRRLDGSEKPLAIQKEYLAKMGIGETQKQQELGDVLSLGYLIRFFAGRPNFGDGFDNSSQSCFCHVRRGRLFHQWTKKFCAFNGSRILIYPNLDGTGDPEVISLDKSKVEEVHLRSRGRCLKITVSSSRKPVYHLYLAFDSLVDLNNWLARSLKAAAQIPPVSDLSNRQLERLPEQVFAVGCERLLTQLNLKHNALRERPKKSDPFTRGYLDDLKLFQSLRSLNLSDNNLKSFPGSLVSLPALTELILSSNKIPEIPKEISNLTNLQTLNLQNNHLCSLPSEIGSLQNLTSLDLSFNYFHSVPPVLVRLKSLEHWKLRGNHISNFPNESLLQCMNHVKKLDLSRNSLKISNGIPVGTLESLSQLDLRSNYSLDSLDLRVLHNLRTLYCQRTGIKTLQINGTSLTYLFAGYNNLESLTVMPIPQSLRWFDVSHNLLTKIPEWLTELSKIEKIVASHNKLVCIPHRLFTCVSSLQHLELNHNEIRVLPTQVENCYVEVLHLNHNKISQLPAEFLASAHKLKILNLAQNNLTYLPPLNPFQDLNKVQQLILSANRFTDSVFHVIVGYRRLKILDLAYNHLRNIDNRCIELLSCLEEVNLSGNRLHCLPPAFAELPKLLSLRVHSNGLTTIPDFSKCSTLKVLDIGSNMLETIDVRCFLSPMLKHLDLACNPRLHLDMSAFRQFESERLVSMVDMSQETQVPQVTSTDVPWQAGFSESSGERNKLCIAQMRIPVFSPKNVDSEPAETKEALFGIIDGGLNNEIPNRLQSLIPEILATEISRNEKNGGGQEDTMKYTMITAHRALEGVGQKMGAACTLCRISLKNKNSAQNEDPIYQLFVANVGHTEAVLCRKGKPVVLTEKFLVAEQSSNSEEYERIRDAGAIITEDDEINGVTPCSRLLGCSFLHPAVIPDPHTNCIDLGEPDEFLVIASRGLWEKMPYAEAIRRIRHIPNPILAAKHLLDITHSYGYTENLSVLVIRFFFNPNFPMDPLLSAFPLLETGVARLGQAQSVLNMNQDSESISTDDEIKSEPQGKTPREKPNYYFEYKRKLKEFMLDSDNSTTAESQHGSGETLHQESRDTIANTETDSYLLAVKGEMSASDLVDAGYNTSEYYNRHCSEAVQELLNSSFKSDNQRQFHEENNNEECSLTGSLEQLKPIRKHPESHSPQSHSSSSSGLGKSAMVSSSSHNSSFESKANDESSCVIMEQSGHCSDGGGTTFLLIGKRKSVDVQVQTMEKVKLRPPKASLLAKEASTPKRSVTGSAHDRSNSRKRFEAAKQQIMEKLELRTPEDAKIGFPFQNTMSMKGSCVSRFSARDSCV